MINIIKFFTVLSLLILAFNNFLITTFAGLEYKKLNLSALIFKASDNKRVLLTLDSLYQTNSELKDSFNVPIDAANRQNDISAIYVTKASYSQ